MLTENSVISDNVITNPSQFIAQRFSGKTRIGLGQFSVIVASEALIISRRLEIFMPTILAVLWILTPSIIIRAARSTFF